MRAQTQRGRTARIPRNSSKMAEMIMQQDQGGVPLTPETICGYLERLRAKGRVQGTIDSYRRKIRRLYQDLPEDGKVIRRDTLRQWREKLAEDGCSAAAINQLMVAAKGYLEYRNAREFQVIDKLSTSSAPQPELNPSEYLRLLSTARSLGREHAYLLAKVCGNSDLPVQELRHLTVEAAQAGMLSISYNYSKEIIRFPGSRFPGSLCRELLVYAKNRGVHSGPVFLTRNGKSINRTNVTVAIRRLCRRRRAAPAACARCISQPERGSSAILPRWWNRPRTDCWRKSS